MRTLIMKIKNEIEMHICLKKIVMKNFIMNQDFTTQNPKSPLFQGHDLKVFPNELLTCPE